MAKTKKLVKWPADGIAPKKAPAGRKKAAKVEKAAGDKTKNDPAQPSLPGMAEDRIPQIETCMKRMGDAKRERGKLKEDIEEARSKIGVLLKKNGLTCYKVMGDMAVIDPGADVVKIKKVKDK